MKFAFSTNAFKKYSLKDAINTIYEIGYDGIEILCDIPHAYPKTLTDTDINEIKQLFSKFEMVISNFKINCLISLISASVNVLG